ncbi:MAG: ATP-dependent nuclease [Sarcina sp.]
MYIKSITLGGPFKKYNGFKKYNIDMLENINKLNIFVGGNNSGKSRMLREIYIDRGLIFNQGNENIIYYNKILDEVKSEIENIVPIFLKKDKVMDGLSFKGIDGLKEGFDYIGEFKQELIDLKNREYKMNEMNNHNLNEYTSGMETFKSNIDKVIAKYEYELKEKKSYIPEFNRIYIPILRGLRKIGEKDELENRTITDYFKREGISQVKVFTGQSLYEDIHKLLCGSYSDREHLKEFERFLENNFFEGRQVVLIPKINSDVLYVKVGNEREYPIYELGDGIQSIIILTFNLFANKGKDMLFFIEEPEIYLHPGLQRKLIEVFLSEEFNSFQYFITTHSNHLLDLTLDIDGISIYKFMKSIDESKGMEEEANFTIENVKNDDNSILETLGVSNSSIFLSNCSIWVEGITDRLYLRKYLEVYQKDKLKSKEIDKIFIEDIHYSFLEYSGGNITHWNFLSENTENDKDLKSMEHNKLFNNIFLISDSDGYLDNKQGMKAERLKKLEKYFAEQFYCLKVKEIENILTPNILKKVVVKFIDKRLSEENKESDSINLFTDCEFVQEDYKDINLGEFIDTKIDEKVKYIDGKKRKFNFKKENTINKKVEFCKYAIKEIKVIEDLSDEAIELCKKLYEFIKSKN